MLKTTEIREWGLSVLRKKSWVLLCKWTLAHWDKNEQLIELYVSFPIFHMDLIKEWSRSSWLLNRLSWWMLTILTNANWASHSSQCGYWSGTLQDGFSFHALLTYTALSRAATLLKERSSYDLPYLCVLNDCILLLEEKNWCDYGILFYMFYDYNNSLFTACNTVCVTHSGSSHVPRTGKFYILRKPDVLFNILEKLRYFPFQTLEGFYSLL